MTATRKLLLDEPWQVVIFSLGMYLVGYGLRNAGLTANLGSLLDRAPRGGVWGVAFGTGIIAALLSLRPDGPDAEPQAFWVGNPDFKKLSCTMIDEEVQ